MNKKSTTEDDFEKEGTTLIGVRTNDGIIVATDKQVTGHSTINEGEKLYQIHKNSVIAGSGLYAPCQKIAKVAKNKINEYEYNRGRNMSLYNIPKRVRHIVSNNREYMFCNLIIAGYKDDKTILSNISGMGSKISEDDYISVGSGSQISNGVLHSNYTNDLSLEEGKELAIKSLDAASDHGLYTGVGIDIAEITNSGVNIKRNIQEL